MSSPIADVSALDAADAARAGSVLLLDVREDDEEATERGRAARRHGLGRPGRDRLNGPGA